VLLKLRSAAGVVGESRDAQLPQVPSRQARKNRFVDLVIAERSLISKHKAKAPRPNDEPRRSYRNDALAGPPQWLAGRTLLPRKYVPAPSIEPTVTGLPASIMLKAPPASVTKRA
jgi:hypothetical protein